jgi:hypothetical protein
MKSLEAELFSLIFLSKTSFYSNSVRSLLQVIRKETRLSQLINLPEDLYQVSETLVEDLRSIYVQSGLQAADANQCSLTISIAPQPTGWTALVLEFQGIYPLLIEEGDRSLITKLIDLLSIGGRMTRSECAVLTLDDPAQQISKLCLEKGGLNLERLPPILWLAAHRVSTFTPIPTKAWQVRQPDGAILLISPLLPDRDVEAIEAVADQINPDDFVRAIGFVVTVLLQKNPNLLLDALQEQEVEQQYSQLQELLANAQPNEAVTEWMNRAIAQIKLKSSLSEGSLS